MEQPFADCSIGGDAYELRAAVLRCFLACFMCARDLWATACLRL
jgi:hypothetical protein